MRPLDLHSLDREVRLCDSVREIMQHGLMSIRSRVVPLSRQIMLTICSVVRDCCIDFIDAARIQDKNHRVA